MKWNWLGGCRMKQFRSGQVSKWVTKKQELSLVSWLHPPSWWPHTATSCYKEKSDIPLQQFFGNDVNSMYTNFKNILYIYINDDDFIGWILILLESLCQHRESHRQLWWICSFFHLCVSPAHKRLHYFLSWEILLMAQTFFMDHHPSHKISHTYF